MIQVRDVLIVGWPVDPKRGFKTASNKSLKRFVLDWYTKFLPLHFRSGAGGRYNYKPRSKKHRALKERRFGHKQPLVFTGRTRRFTRNIPRITVGRDKVTMKVPVTWYIKAGSRHSDGRAPNMEDELLRTTPGERDTLMKGYIARVAELMMKSKKRKRIKIAA